MTKLTHAVTQQNAALVEQATAAAHSLGDQATGLASAVSTFQLPDEVNQVRKNVQPAMSTAVSEADAH